MCHAISGEHACQIANTIDNSRGSRTSFFTSKVERHGSTKIGIWTYEQEGYKCYKRYWNKLLTVTIDKDQVIWVASGPTVSDGVSVLLRSQQGDSFVCSHGLGARSNVVADVTVCSGDADTVKGQASGIVNSILQKIPG